MKKEKIWYLQSILSEHLDFIRVKFKNICTDRQTDRHKNITIMNFDLRCGSTLGHCCMWLYIRALLHVIAGSLIGSLMKLSVVN
jgi:hypothetical protein